MLSDGTSRIENPYIFGQLPFFAEIVLIERVVCITKALILGAEFNTHLILTKFCNAIALQGT